MKQIILASGSSSRANMLQNSGVRFDQQKPNVDEDSLKISLK